VGIIAAALRVRSIDFEGSEIELKEIVDASGEGPAAASAVPVVTVTEFPRTEAGADVEEAVEAVDDVDRRDDVDASGLRMAEAAERVTLSDRRGQEM
jgi:hypothetical protein